MVERFYFPQLSDGPAAELSGAEARHLVKVLRKNVGDEVVLFDGRGHRATAAVVEMDKRSVRLQILARQDAESEQSTSLVLATAVPKGERFRWLVEKATELGVDRLVPLETARSVVHPGDGKLEKMEQTVIAACKQSNRDRLMAIDAKTSWQDFVANEFPGRRVYVAHPTGAPCNQVVDEPGAIDAIIAAVGPEGGFDDREIAMAVNAGALLVNLGPQTLRIETAALAMAATLRLTR
ncbi:MAG: RsmE family RNA methyltransferase [Planctomycetaceae bacterium]